MMRSKFVFIFSVIAFMLSGFSVLMSGCVAFSLPLDGNNASFTLGTLSLLVTVLIGWQIYSKIDIEIRVKETEKELRDLKRKTEIDTKTALFVSLTQLGKSAFNKIDKDTDPVLMEKADAIQSLFNALCLWEKEMDSSLAKEAYGYCIMRLLHLIKNVDYTAEYSEEKDIFVKAALKTGIRELIDFATGIKVKE